MDLDGMKVKARAYWEEIYHNERGELGMNAIIGIAIGLIIAAFILIPGIQRFATQIMTDMQTWWTNAISSKVFIS